MSTTQPATKTGHDMPQQNYQDALLSELQKVAENLGASTVAHRDYANTCAIIAGTPFQQDATLRFEVHRDAVQILFNGASSGTKDMSFNFKITDTDKAQQVLDR